jgi:hypothetical protein
MADDRAVPVHPTPLLARVLAVLSLVCAIWIGYGAVDGVLDSHENSLLEFLLVLMVVVVALGGAAAYLVWLAAQLWWHFSALAGRLASATIVAVACIFLMDRVEWATEPLQQPWLASMVWLVLFVTAPVAYRRLAETIIERTHVDDPRDAHGHPVGHMTRVKVYCVVLGWAVFLTAGSVVRNLLPLRHDGPWIIVGLCPIPLGWLAYRVTLWRMTPPTAVALAPGGVRSLTSGDHNAKRAARRKLLTLLVDHR